MGTLRTLSAAFVLCTGCFAVAGALAGTLLADAIVREAARPLSLPVEIGAALSELSLGRAPGRGG